MKTILKISIYLFLCLVMVTSSSCVFNINEDLDCLKCSYKDDGREISEELCNPFFTESEKAEMRVRMQAAADSIGTTLDCFEH